jgi:hypothetical protein
MKLQVQKELVILTVVVCRRTETRERARRFISVADLRKSGAREATVCPHAWSC